MFPPGSPLARTLALLLVAVASGAGCREGALPFTTLSDPAEIVDRMAERAAADVAGVRDFIVVGPEATLYFRRASTATDSLPAFDVHAIANDSTQESVADPYHLPNVPALATALRAGARLVGTDTLDGRRVYVLDGTDRAALDGTLGVPGGAARVFVDTETFRLTGLRVTLPPPDTSMTRPIVQTQRYTDFQTTGPLTIPARSRSMVEGLDQLIPEDQRIIEGGNLAIARAQAERLGPAERERALRELDRRDRLLNRGMVDETFVVRSVRVNEGVPEELFDRSPIAPAPLRNGPPAPAPGGPPLREPAAPPAR